MPISPQEIVRLYYDNYNARRFQDNAALFARDAVIEHAPFGRMASGGAGYLASAERSTIAFPDAQLEVLGITAHGDTIHEIDLMATGTHSGTLDLGAYGSFEATGAFIHVRHREVLEIRGGAITYASVTLDVNDLIAQLSRGVA